MCRHGRADCPMCAIHDTAYHHGKRTGNDRLANQARFHQDQHSAASGHGSYKSKSSGCLWLVAALLGGAAAMNGLLAGAAVAR